ncbi:hypothetical protein D3C81_1452170 [compost metagenome]
MYCSTATSSLFGEASRTILPRPLASASFSLTACGRLNGGTIFLTYLTTALTTKRLSGGSMSPTSVTSTWRMPVFGSTSSARWAMLARHTSALAPESLNWCSISRTVYSGLVLTTMRPARMAPNTTTGYCSTLGNCTAMRSPGCRSVFCCR